MKKNTTVKTVEKITGECSQLNKSIWKNVDFNYNLVVDGTDLKEYRKIIK